MKSRILMLICLVACMQTAMAQNSVESIRKRYADIKEYIANRTEDNQYDGATWAEYYNLEARQWLPGTGGHKENIYLYWGEREEEKIYPSHYLKFATTQYNFSAMNYYEEYLFDKDGQVAFIYTKAPFESFKGNGETMDYEFRFYLNKGKLLKVIVKNSAVDKNDFKEVYSGAVLKKEYTETFNKFMAKAKSMRNLFINIEKVTYNYED